MIRLDSSFIEAFSPNEQLVMLHLLLHAANNGVVEFSDRHISRETGITYQKVRTIHQKWMANKNITNAPSNADDNAPSNASTRFVTISDYGRYSNFNKIYNAPSNADDNADDNAQKEEINKEIDKVFPHTPLPIDKEINKEENNPPIIPPDVSDENKRLNDELEQVKKRIAELNDENIKLRKENAELAKRKEKNKKSENFDVRADLSYVNVDYYPIWLEWLDYKDKIKKQYKTGVGAKKQYNHLVSLSNGDINKARAIVDQSIMREYEGLFDVKDYKSPAISVDEQAEKEGFPYKDEFGKHYETMWDRNNHQYSYEDWMAAKNKGK